MKNKFKILYAIFGLVFLFTACTPKEYELGALLDKSELSFTIVPSSENPNDIVLTSTTAHVTPMWITPYGRSTRVKDTVNIAFPGTYKFVYGVESAGGFVQADTTTITVNTVDENAVSGTMWVNLTGGYGKEKTWYLDLDANAKSKYWTGPMYYYGTNDSWLSVTDGVSVGGDSWNWKPTYSDNTWLMAAVDFGSMTFNLKNGPYVISNHTSTTNGVTMGGTQSGSYMLDETNYKITLTDVTLIHPIEYNGKVKTWTGSFKIFSLTANSMQIAVLRDATLSGESACYYVYNFVSKDYYDTH
jgi:hypothetical protein